MCAALARRISTSGELVATIHGWVGVARGGAVPMLR
jgi:hypothetical protein